MPLRSVVSVLLITAVANRFVFALHEDQAQ
jgi:hypothetical protein